MVPPRWVRRLVLAPLVPLLTVALLVALPVTVLVASIASTFLPGRWRALRVLYFLLLYLLTNSVMLVWLLVLWVGAGFGRHLAQPRWQHRHYQAMRRYLDILVRSGTRVFRVGLHVDTTDLAWRGHAPLLVFSRHAGPGDSFLLVHELLRAGRRPRIVLKGTLQWEPTIDVALNRLPCYFVPRDAPRGTGTRAIRKLAAGMGPGDALVLFPEGRNFTPQRRLLSIDKLEAQGRHGEAEAAREMRHVLAPRTGGAIAALEGAPDADIALVVHAGLEHFSSAVDLWRGIPLDTDLEGRVWWVPRRDVPAAREARDAWLRWWWRRIDAWLIEHYGEDAVPDAVVEAVAAGDVPPAPE